MALNATLPQSRDVPAAVEILGYEILGELGRGGMGVIYKARQLSPRRLVALKMILAGEHAGEEALARFKREADAVAQLSHPNIVPIHEVGEHQGRPYLTLEFIEGGNLTQHLHGRQLDFREAAELLRQLARAMQFAHRRGILHRDLKPGNILLAPDGTPKIVDFGLAKQLDGAASVPAAAATQSGAILGTPSYMAPEQAGGKSKDIGPAADIYALGAVLYECLTGRPPFQAETTLDTLLKVAAEEPVPPHQLRPNCPRDLEIICLKCLQKEPARRYASAADLADDLRRWLDGETIHARSPGKLHRWTRRLRRRKELLYLAGGAVLALAVIVSAFALLRPSSDAAPIAQTPDSPQAPPATTVSRKDDAIDRARLLGRRRRTSNNVKQLAIALLNLHDAYRGLPPATLCDPRTGRPLLSWRVAILPFIEQAELYKRFKLDEPWDGPNNSKLLPLMPKQFAMEGVQSKEPYSTYYQVLVGPGTAFEPGRVPHRMFGFAGLRFPEDFPDGSSNTILFVEAAEAVPWTKPADVPYDPQGPLPRFGSGAFTDGFFTATADGGVRFVEKSLPEKTLRGAITRNGRETLDEQWQKSIGRLEGMTPEEAAKAEEAAKNLRQMSLDLQKDKRQK